MKQPGFLGGDQRSSLDPKPHLHLPTRSGGCTEEFLQSLRISEQRELEDLIPMTVSKEDYQRHWKRSRKKTLSMSGLHFGHWKVAAESDFLAEIHAMFTEIMVSTGHSQRRWQQGLSVMLEKVLGCRLLEKLRAILLMEADLNFANQLFFGYWMMIKVEEDKAILAEIVGSRKGRQAIDVALNRCLMWDAIHLKCICAIMTLADATNCYVRMANALISLCTEWLGLQKPVINSLLRTIQQRLFYLRTGFGDSDHFYGGPSEMPLQGCCQGNGGGLGMWVSVMIPLVENLH